MIYVINRSEDKNILISSFLPLPIGNEEDDPSPIPLYVFDWNYNDLAPSIRYFVVDPSVENCNIYFPEVLDFLDTIKDQQNPPQYNLPKRIYDAKTRIDAFNSSLQTLINIGILDKVEVKPVKDNIIYDIDLTSQLERNYSADIVDIVNSWRYLARSEKLAIEEIYKTTNLDRKEQLIKEYQIPLKFLPIYFRFPPKQKEGARPEFKNSDKIYKEEETEDVIGNLIHDHFHVGETISSEYFEDISRAIEEKYGKNIKISDLYKYFEVIRVPRKNLYKIIKNL